MVIVNLGSLAGVAAGKAAFAGGITSASAVVALRLNARAINITDTTGHGDFIAVNTIDQFGKRVR